MKLIEYRSYLKQLNMCSWNIKLLTINLLIINTLSQTTNKTIISLSNSNSVINLEYDGILGIGWGVFSIIISLIVGLILCIYGFATVYKLLFYTIGFMIPLIVFFIMAFAPLQIDSVTDIAENLSKNSMTVIRWLFLVVLITGILSLIVPFLKIWTIVLVPQRVDSRSQREYLEKVEKIIIDDPKNNNDDKKDQNINNNFNIPKNSILNEAEVLPLNNQYIVPEQQQDIEMANLENLQNKERKKRIGALKRRIMDEN